MSKIANCRITFHTNDEDKDEDTRVTFTLRDEDNVTAAFISNNFAHFDDESTHTYPVPIRNPSEKSKLQRGNWTIEIEPHGLLGHDTWRFSAEIYCLFSDGSTFTSQTGDQALSQDRRQATGAVEGTISSSTASLTVESPVVYEHNNYGGRSQMLDEGRYNLGQLTFGNDMVSSVRVPMGWRITLYQHANFQGATKVLTADTPALPDFNDQTSSIVVEQRPVVYEHNNYSGCSQMLDEGRYNLGQLAIGNDVISSVRVPNGWRITLYQHANFQGATKVLTTDTPALPDFNDQTSSILVERP